jgi:signal transduction histidine kinase
MDSILVVEDSKSFAAVLTENIQKGIGAKVMHAATFDKAVSMIESSATPFSLCVLDLNIPGAPNGEVVDFALGKKIPVIVMTGAYKNADRSVMMDKGVLDYFVKDNMGVVSSMVTLIKRISRNKNFQLLVVDDSRSARHMLSDFLMRYGFTIFEAKNGKEALELLNLHKIDLVLTDFHMPIMDGCQLTKKIRSRYPSTNIRIIGISSQESSDLAIRFIKAGASDFLSKPYQKEELLLRLFQNISIIESNRTLEEKIAKRTEQLEQRNTERKRLIKSLEETLDIAESANRAKSEFLANMSHEIRSPMNAIIGMTDLVLDTKLTLEQQTNLEIVQQSSSSLLELINSILDLSKIEAGQMHLEHSPFDLRGQVEAACSTMAIKAQEKGVELYCRIHPSVPEAVIGDSLRLKQVLINLISNAIKFTSEGEVVVYVDTIRQESTESHDNHLTFSITDTGVGIAPDKLKQVFERFNQADGSTTRKYGGTGLGLTISKYFVEMMDGHIELESALGKGSTFRFAIHLEISERVTTWTTAKGLIEERKGVLGTNPIKEVRILLADGNPTGRKIIGAILRDFGAVVDYANNLQEFVAMVGDATAAGTPYVCAIFDYQLVQDPNPLLDEMKPLCNDTENRLLIMLPSNVVMKYLQPQSWIQNAVPLKKPVGMFKLLRGINWILGCSEESSSLGNSQVFKKAAVSLNILLVEDLVNNQKVVKGTLEKVGHMITVANHGGEALELMQKLKFDLILMDLQMPEMGGMETTRRIRSGNGVDFTSSAIPIIAVTAWPCTNEKSSCIEVGMNGYLRKPYHPHELLDTIAPFVIKRKSTGRQKKRSNESSVLISTDADAKTLANSKKIFLENKIEWFAEINKALNFHDINRADKAVGQLKNAATDVGARQVVIRAMRFKGRVDMGEWSTAKEMLIELEDNYSTAVEALKNQAGK